MMPTVCKCGNNVALAPHDDTTKVIDWCGACQPEKLQSLIDKTHNGDM